MFVTAFCGVLCGAFLVVMLFLLRLIAVLRAGAECKPAKKGSVCVLIVAGSGKMDNFLLMGNIQHECQVSLKKKIHVCPSFAGGHTTEVIRLMGSLSQFYTPRHYVIADTDKMSEEKIRTFEASKEKNSTQAQVTWNMMLGLFLIALPRFLHSPSHKLQRLELDLVHLLL